MVVRMNRRVKQTQRGTLTALGISLVADVLLALALFLFAANALAARSTPVGAFEQPRSVVTYPVTF